MNGKEGTKILYEETAACSLTIKIVVCLIRPAMHAIKEDAFSFCEEESLYFKPEQRTIGKTLKKCFLV